jgi:hypothetical protein
MEVRMSEVQYSSANQGDDSISRAKRRWFLDWLPPMLEAYLEPTFGKALQNEVEQESYWLVAYLTDPEEDWQTVEVCGVPGSYRIIGRHVGDWFAIVNALEKTQALSVRH